MKRSIWCCVMLFHSALLHAQEPARYAVLIHEIMADPTPSRGLPHAEYIELYNRSGKDMDLRNFQLSNGNTVGKIGLSFILKADSMVVLCSSGSLPLFAPYGRSIVLSPFPSLDNDGDTLVFLTPKGQVLHAIAWDRSWYGNDVKAEGGWSLEMVDRGLPCVGLGNWAASKANIGGTPGKANSISGQVRDSSSVLARYAYLQDSLTLMVIFNKSLSGPPTLQVERNKVTDAEPIPPLFNVLQAKLDQPIPKGSVTTLRITRAVDCGKGKAVDQEVPFGLPRTPAAKELVVNELLFDPPSGGQDYLELYNRSDAVIDLSALLVSNRSSSGRIASTRAIVTTPMPLFPSAYVVISPDTAWTNSYYAPGAVSMIQAALPTYPDNEGDVVLTDRMGNILDELHYTARWHQPLVANPKGVALERLMPQGETNDPLNWTSASSTVRYGTPGYKNSQQVVAGEGRGRILSPSGRLISPDQDGRDDLLILAYKLDAPGYVANLAVFDTYGKRVGMIANNALCGTEGFFRWDGRSQAGQRLPKGNYIIYAEFFNPTGKRVSEKLAIGVW